MTTKYVREIAFLQGDEATGAFDIMYPSGRSGGDNKTMRATIDYLLQFAPDVPSEPTGFDWSAFLFTGRFTTKYHILVWNYPKNWICLYQKVTKKEHDLASA